MGRFFIFAAFIAIIFSYFHLNDCKETDWKDEVEDHINQLYDQHLRKDIKHIIMI